jgi:hypothetical protein
MVAINLAHEHSAAAVGLMPPQRERSDSGPKYTSTASLGCIRQGISLLCVTLVPLLLVIPVCVQVTQGLYIGSAWAEMSEPALTKAGITDILQVGFIAPTASSTAVVTHCDRPPHHTAWHS